MSVKNALNWTNTVTDCLNKIGVGIIQNKIIHIKAFHRMKDIFHQECFVEIGRETSKLRTYAFLKTRIEREKYLVNIPNINYRTAISKIRLSNHNLMIEKGRHLRLGKEERYCPFCPGIVETEKHFILVCKTFANARNFLFSEVGKLIPGFEFYHENDIFKILLCDEKVLPITGNSKNTD